MSHISSRAVVLVLAGWLALAGFACGDGDEPSESQPPAATSGEDMSPAPAESEPDKPGPEVTIVEVRVKSGRVRTARELVTVAQSALIKIEVTSDVSDEVHVHGYERKVEVEPGKKAVLKFHADLTGRFEIELEESGLLLFELRVR